MADELNLKEVDDDEVSGLFRELDINDNGMLSKDEIKVFTKQLMDIILNYALSEVAKHKIKNNEITLGMRYYLSVHFRLGCECDDIVVSRFNDFSPRVGLPF
jgi:hypothetical protein